MPSSYKKQGPLNIFAPGLAYGYTKMPNVLLQAIIVYPFTLSQQKAVLYIIRRTLGWHKDKDRISHGDICRETGLTMRHVKKIVEKLVRDNVLIKGKEGRNNILGLNLSYLQWKLWINSVLPDTTQCPAEHYQRCSGGHYQGALANTSLLYKERNIKEKERKESAGISGKEVADIRKNPVRMDKIIGFLGIAQNP